MRHVLLCISNLRYAVIHLIQWNRVAKTKFDSLKCKATVSAIVRGILSLFFLHFPFLGVVSRWDSDALGFGLLGSLTSSISFHYYLPGRASPPVVPGEALCADCASPRRGQRVWTRISDARDRRPTVAKTLDEGSCWPSVSRIRLSLIPTPIWTKSAGRFWTPVLPSMWHPCTEYLDWRPFQDSTRRGRTGGQGAVHGRYRQPFLRPVSRLVGRRMHVQNADREMAREEILWSAATSLFMVSEWSWTVILIRPS